MCHESVCLFTFSFGNNVWRVIGHVSDSDMKPSFASIEYVYDTGDLCFFQLIAFDFLSGVAPKAFEFIELLDNLPVGPARNRQCPCTAIGMAAADRMCKSS